MDSKKNKQVQFFENGFKVEGKHVSIEVTDKSIVIIGNITGDLIADKIVINGRHTGNIKANRVVYNEE